MEENKRKYKCNECKNNKDMDNYFEGFHEYCEKGHCVLCVSQRDIECKDFENKVQ